MDEKKKEQKQEEILKEFTEKIVKSQKDMDLEFQKILDDNFWDLLT